ncbi:MAG: hypothetical protein AAF360_11510 [Pseudomonadota bacterium]
MFTATKTAPAAPTTQTNDEAVEARRYAFDANLASNLNDALGDRLHPEYRSRLVRLFGKAHQETRHMLNLRMRIPTLTSQSYLVLQAGVAASPPPGLDGIGPLAAKVLRRAPRQALDELTSGERRVVCDCIERSEITSRHALDWRPRLGFGRAQAYLTLIAGRERRTANLTPDRNRRALPDNQRGDFLISLALISLALVSVWLIGGALFDAYIASWSDDTIGAPANIAG